MKTLDIAKAVILAPMEDVTDTPFRLICKRLGADIVYTEFVNTEGLIRHSEKTRRKMLFLPEERPFGIQLYGGGEESMDQAARMAGELEPDLIDINCGCWVRKVVGRGAGAGLLKDLPRMERIIAATVRSVDLPVTVKTRLGWDSDSINIVEVARMVEQAGARALTIHCRTRAQGHAGEPDYTWIPTVKASVSIPIIVNGGIDGAEKACRVFDTTGCDGVMIARAAIHNPWIFAEIKHFLRTGKLLPQPTFHERVRLMCEHLQLSVAHKGERRGVLEFRKHYAGYLRSQPGVSGLRAGLMQYVELQPVLDTIGRFAETISEAAPVEPQEPLAV